MGVKPKTLEQRINATISLCFRRRALQPVPVRETASYLILPIQENRSVLMMFWIRVSLTGTLQHLITMGIRLSSRTNGVAVGERVVEPMTH